MKDPDTKNSKGSIARNGQNLENSTENVDQCHMTKGVISGHGDPALLSWVDPVLGNLGLPLMVGLGSTGTVRCWQTCPMLAKFDRQESLGMGCCTLP